MYKKIDLKIILKLIYKVEMFRWFFRREELPLHGVYHDISIVIHTGWIHGFTDAIMNLLEEGKWN